MIYRNGKNCLYFIDFVVYQVSIPSLPLLQPTGNAQIYAKKIWSSRHHENRYFLSAKNLATKI